MMKRTDRAAALKHFRKVDERFYEATRAHHQEIPSRLAEKSSNQGLFSALVSIIVSQQLATGAARAILLRVKRACGGRISVQSVTAARTTSLSRAGLSGAKIKTIRALTRAILSGTLSLPALTRMPDAEVKERLLEIWGIGPWSVEMYMMFSLGRPDVFSVGDLGLVRSLQEIYALPRTTARDEMVRIAEKWSPFRTYAALLLWKTRDSTAARVKNQTEHKNQTEQKKRPRK